MLLQGASGTGKSALIAEFARTHPLLFALGCSCLGELVTALESSVGLDREEFKMPARVHRLSACLPEIARPVVIDNVARVPPRVAHLVRFLMLRQPVWLIVRSTDPPNIGHVWPYLFLFKPIEVPPFSLAETLAFLAGADFAGDRRELLAAAQRLHRFSAGHPATLTALVTELRCRTYDLDSSEGLRLLALNARITAVTACIWRNPARVRAKPHGADP